MSEEDPELPLDAREKRLVENEAMFREINERIEAIAASQGPEDGHLYEFLCECSNRDCTLRVELTVSVYESVRRESTQFLVAPGHELPEIEDVVSRGVGFQVVRKRGGAAVIAEAEDTRN